ncbi:MAG: response regulator transcription factor [Deltaproteobacteria bacterium]|nr:response regulator transcription factor [Deltaproteobacteria bacterium]
MNRILIVDDDIELCELLTEYLGQEGFEVSSVHGADDGIAQSAAGGYSLLVLDVMLPGKSGFEVLREIRQHSRIPVIMLTARGDEVDRIVGLEMGADDYMPKPFNPRELVARIRAIQRRTVSPPRTDREDLNAALKIGDIELDPGARTVHRSGAEVILTAVEFSFLEMLLRHAGQVVSRENLAREVLGRPLSPYDRSIDVHISSLRRKIAPEGNGCDQIKTIRGVGYQFILPPAKGAP